MVVAAPRPRDGQGAGTRRSNRFPDGLCDRPGSSCCSIRCGLTRTTLACGRHRLRICRWPESVSRPLRCTRLWGGNDVASGLHGGSLLVVDLELVHMQPLHLKLLDLEPPDNRTPDRQPPDRQGADGAGPDRRRPNRKRADANRAELLQATTARWGLAEWELGPLVTGRTRPRPGLRGLRSSDHAGRCAHTFQQQVRVRVLLPALRARSWRSPQPADRWRVRTTPAAHGVVSRGCAGAPEARELCSNLASGLSRFGAVWGIRVRLRRSDTAQVTTTLPPARRAVLAL
jgi:hypothetical protein